MPPLLPIPTRLTALGGTLIEVLVSLLIVTLVLTSVLEVTGHRRKALVEAQRSHVAMDLAIQWRSARLADEPWARGYEGTFPDTSGPRWTLEPLPQPDVTQTGLAPDDQWQELHVLTSTQDTLDVWWMVRLTPPPVSPLLLKTAGGGIR